VYKCESTVNDIQQLEDMKKHLDNAGCSPVWSKSKMRFRYLTVFTHWYVKCRIYYILYEINYSIIYSPVISNMRSIILNGIYFPILKLGSYLWQVIIK
jgi:hypothetical protein